MFTDIDVMYINATQQDRVNQLALFLHKNGLQIDSGISEFVTLYQRNQLIACGGLDGNIIKCVAITPSLRGAGILLRLITELIYLAFEKGRRDLFVYTKPENEKAFRSCGFTTLVHIPGVMIFMENSTQLARYTGQLALLRRPGKKIGAIVMNANPCTLGHLHLIRYAAAQCDWLHVFLVNEDKSTFPFEDRLRLVREASAGIDKLTIHPGSQYVISRATFPAYFLKESAVVRHCHAEIDITLFRQYLAPALGITHRFVGSEPFCPLTAAYNQEMRHWLTTPTLPFARIEWVEIPRLMHQKRAISASTVRALFNQGDLAAVAPLVPPATLRYLQRRRPASSVATACDKKLTSTGTL
ncbi:[citrate (pro-3S)-lyase] ligase [Citrobacter amalonaticus]|uniref:[Citrate [pro-3S]-lyase] ligase n=1 Tax=Citrobacter amalonaticus TaxID=35703 RepID=A0A2S4RR14_CITAM|nr:[citrate (pro-3S)-lyase] ligase [Citrobacter amalonaticus]POT54620.1 [citrate (pro-3S)-lyase] ligase [Citrobacter amalonaticus]POT69566.1 [citrate (pro-3S)-lyase] ligase [Citrobacter amalonaticus]POU60377.1 [citrate (pro-3S)-lyase] ligase [Citrobacter amalonaticus]POV02672.1 [citrate (pro-3S)-lyase] ligase [Citrobacter amalonaticus]